MSALKNLLEGKPFRSPVHPALVHLPVALFPISVLLDVGSHVYPASDLHLVSGAYLSLLGGIVTGLLAAVFGWVDYTSIRNDHPAKKTATLHLVLNVAAIVLFAVSAWLRRNHLDAPGVPWGPLWLSVVGLVGLGYSGYLGGHLVYSDGIAVGRHRRATRLPSQTIRASAASGAAVVGDAAAVREGESLRADIDGTVIAVARIDGKIHAFQEFCTHRYGPLSEGQLAACQVTCPWHGSAFDVRTGRVLNGPAKVDLKTYRVEVKDGKIRVLVPARP